MVWQRDGATICPAKGGPVLLTLGIVTFLLLAPVAAAVRAAFSSASLMLSLVVLEGLGLLLLGLPGAAFLETLAPVLQGSGFPPMTPDAAWPSAIAMSLAWPLGLVPAYVAARLVRSAGVQQGAVALVVLAVTSLLVGVPIYIFLATA